MQPDLLALLVPPCGECQNLGDAIDSGIRYCHGDKRWRWATGRVDGCAYRDRVIERPVRGSSRVEALRDLIENPRHGITDKDRKWLNRELRAELGKKASQSPVTSDGEVSKAAQPLQTTEPKSTSPTDCQTSGGEA